MSGEEISGRSRAIAASTQPVEPVDPWPDPVKSADRVLRLLDFLADSGPRPVGQIARELGLPLSSAHKLLKTVQRRNYIDYDADTRTYRLGWRIWQLSRAYAGVNDLVDKARPLMQQIVDAVGESVNLARLEGTDCVYLAFVESPYGARRVVAVGERFPANASAVGKVLLAALDEDDLRRRLSGTRLRRFTQRTITDVEELVDALRTVRIRGYATSKEELLPGLYTVAMPIRDSSRQVVAAMSVSLPSARWNDHSARRTLRELHSAVYDLCRQLGSMEDLDEQALEIADLEWLAELGTASAPEPAPSPVTVDRGTAMSRTITD